MSRKDIEDMKIEVHRLQSRTDLLNSTVELINREWPKSMEHRLWSLAAHQDSSASLPCSLVITDGSSSKVLAHAQLLAVLGRPQAAYLHDVLVSPEWRGCGLGRRIMKEAEDYARDCHLNTLHLFTTDKADFYTHLGYERGPVISPQKKCMAKLDLQQVTSLLENVGGGSVSEKETVECKNKNSSPSSTPDPTLSKQPPPPPPPPPPSIKTAVQSHPGVWMMKALPP